MNVAEFHFIRPFWLFALIPAAFILFGFYRSRFHLNAWAAFCDPALLPFVLQQKTSVANRLPLGIGAVALVLVVLALAGPTWERLPTPVFRDESALVIALDLSDSMNAGDITPSRLGRARYKIADLLKHRKDGQTALLVFAGEAYVVTPLTNDTATINSQLAALTTDIMPNPGNNAAAALLKAANLFKQAGMPTGQILMITDGVDSAEAQEALLALSDHYTLSILGVGTQAGAPIVDAKGGFSKNSAGTLVVPKLDAANLAVLAQSGGGIYQTSTGTDDDLNNLASMVTSPGVRKNQGEAGFMLERWDDKGPWLLLAVLPLAALVFRKGVLSVPLLAMMFVPDNAYALDWQALWQNQDQRGQQAYEKKAFDKAATLFADSEWKGAAFYQAGDYQKALESFLASQKPKTGSLYYNQGNALAKLGRFPEAIQAYDNALKLEPQHADAQFNKGLVEKAWAKQQQSDPDRQNQSTDKEQKQQQDGHQNPKTPDRQADRPSDNTEKPEQKPEHSEHPEAANQPPKPSAAQQTEQSESKAGASGAQSRNGERQQPAESAVPLISEEQRQANEQWLNRIPDDPSGLLRRKFKYQYSQQKH